MQIDHVIYCNNELVQKMFFLVGVVHLLILIPAAVSARAPSLTNLGTLIISKEQPVGDPPTNTHTTTCNKNGCIGRVWVFFGDGTHGDRWGTINNKHRIGQYGKDIICRQLGYQKAYESAIEPKALKNASAVPVWLKEVECGSQPSNKKLMKSNIFECKHSVCHTSDKCDHMDDLYLSCYIPLHKNQVIYNGEVSLCPPDEKPPGMQATLGLAQISLSSGLVRSVGLKNLSFSVVAAMDSFCRQLGFSKHRGHYLLSDVKKFHFSKCEKSTWFDLTSLHHRCTKEKSYCCFGCCIIDDFLVLLHQECTSCDPRHNIVVSCENTHYLTQDVHSPKGNQDRCEFNALYVLPPGVCYDSIP